MFCLQNLEKITTGCELSKCYYKKKQYINFDINTVCYVILQEEEKENAAVAK